MNLRTLRGDQISSQQSATGMECKEDKMREFGREYASGAGWENVRSKTKELTETLPCAHILKDMMAIF